MRRLICSERCIVRYRSPVGNSPLSTSCLLSRPERISSKLWRGTSAKKFSIQNQSSSITTMTGVSAPSLGKTAGAGKVKILTLFGFVTLGCSGLNSIRPTGQVVHQVLSPGSASILNKAAVSRVQKALEEQWSIPFRASAHTLASSTFSLSARCGMLPQSLILGGVLRVSSQR